MNTTPANLGQYDVAIIGYGPVGVTAANLLGQRGLRVLVAERDADIYARARAISTDEETLRIWQSVGLAERAEADMLVGSPIAFVDRRGRSFVDFEPPYRGNGHPAQAFIYQPALERLLRDGVERFANVDVRLGHECIRFGQDADGVDLTLLAGDSLVRARASYVIAADGGSSPTRGQLGINFEGRTYEDRWVVIDTKVLKPWPEVDTLRFHCDPDRPAVDCPTPLGHHRWEFPVLPGEDEAALVSHDYIWTLLARYGVTPAHVDILRSVVYSHHVRFAARWRSGRIFLAGDAAHAMPPWIGQGMASGVRDAANLCWKLAAVLDGSLPATVLDTYETERKPHVRRTTDAAVFVGRLITERSHRLAALRNHVLRPVARVRAVDEFTRQRYWAPPTRYTEGLLGAKADRVVGRLVPQPIVADAEGRHRLLDDVAPGWRVLVLDPSGLPSLTAWRDAGADVLLVMGEGALPAAGAVVDSRNELVDWMKGHGLRSVAVRPDGIVYATAPAGTGLAAPPSPKLRAVPPQPVVAP